MKGLKRVLTASLAGMMLTAAFTGCKSNGAKDPNTLIIKATDLGFGVEWLNDLAEAYQAKRPEVKFEITPYPGQQGIQALQGEMEALTGDTDIYYTRPSNYHKAIYQGTVSTQSGKYDCVYEDLTDIWTTPYEGENGATMQSKTDEVVADYLKVNGKYYGVNWADGFMGIVRNKVIWNQLGLTENDVPLTTDQLFALCDKINDNAVNKDASDTNDIAPFIYSKSEEYYTSVWSIWAFQYDGREAENNFINGLDPAGEFSEYLFSYPGMKKSLSFIQQLLKKDANNKYVYQHKDSDSLSFTEMQSYFFLNQALFCINGSWLEIEANKGKDPVTYDADFIKAPVISALADKLKTVNSDDQLAEVVKFVDGHPDVGDNERKPLFASDEDVERVREARTFQFIRTGRDHTAIVPAWSKKKDLAKDFLKFMYSDEGLAVYYKAQGGMLPPAKSTAGLPELQKSVFTSSASDALLKGNFSNQSFCYKSKIFNVGGVRANFTNNCKNFVQLFTQDDAQGADYIVKMNTESLQSRWNSISAACK